MSVRRTTRAVLACLVLASSVPAAGQSIEDLSVRHASNTSKLAFGFVGLYEVWAGINRDRPEASTWLLLCPQLKIGPSMLLQTNWRFNVDFLQRMDDYGFYVDDPQIEFADNRIWKEPHTGITFSGRVRYYFPLSKASRQADSYGQLRFYGKVSVTVWKLYLAAEFNGQKYFNRYTTWAPDSTPGTDAWFHAAGRDDYIENNTSYGFGETFTVTLTPVDGLDLSFIYGLYQSRHYDPGTGHGDRYGSSYLQQPRWTTWDHLYRFILDVTYGIGSIPAVAASPRLKDTILKDFYLSFGYFAMAPQLKPTGWSMNPIDPRYGSFYFDISLIH